MNYSLLEDIEITSVSTAIPKGLEDADFGKEGSANSNNEAYRSKKEQTASDLGFVAAEAAMAKFNISPDSIGVLLFVSTTPDYRSPATAFVLQKRLNIPASCVAFDVNQGNTGFTQGLMMASSMLLASNGTHGLLILGDTRSKQSLGKSNLMTGDSGGAVIIKQSKGAKPIHISMYTDSANIKSAYIASGGFRTSIPKEHPSFLNEVASNMGSYSYDNEIFRRQAVSLFHDYFSHFSKKAGIREKEERYIILQTLDDEMKMSLLEEHSEINKKNLLFLPERFGNSGSANPLVYLTENIKLFNPNKKSKFLCWTFGEGLTGAFISFEISSAAILETIQTDSYYDDGHVSHNMDA